MPGEAAQSILLGVVQGLTEFLPVSSSGHLALIETFAGVESRLLLLNVLLHAGTLAALCAYYRRDLAALARAGLRMLRRAPVGGVKEEDERRTLTAIVAADAVTAAVALLLYGTAERFSHDPAMVGTLLAATGALLALTPFIGAPRRPVDWRLALFIGLLQGLAALPGLSRSGATIVACLLVTSDRREAVRFSFLAAIPLLAAAAALEAVKGGGEVAGNLALFLPGIAAAFVAGLLSLRLVERLAVGRRLHWFAWYLVPVGLALALVG